MLRQSFRPLPLPCWIKPQLTIDDSIEWTPLFPYDFQTPALVEALRRRFSRPIRCVQPQVLSLGALGLFDGEIEQLGADAPPPRLGRDAEPREPDGLRRVARTLIETGRPKQPSRLSIDRPPEVQKVRYTGPSRQPTYVSKPIIRDRPETKPFAKRLPRETAPHEPARLRQTVWFKMFNADIRHRSLAINGD